MIFGFKIDSTLLAGIIGVIGALFGAIIGGIITYRLNAKQMKKSLVLDLQIKSSQNMINEINNLRNSSLKVYSNLSDFVFYLQQYKSTFNELGLKNNRLFESDANSSQMYLTLNIQVKLITNKFEDIRLIWQEFIDSFNSFWTTFESNQVILNEFYSIYNFLLEEFDIYTENYFKITNNYQMKILSDINLKNQIDESVLKNTEDIWKVFKKSYYNLNSYLGDFIKELQNKYLSELFNNYKIPKREPKDKSYKVLTLENNEAFTEQK